MTSRVIYLTLCLCGSLSVAAQIDFGLKAGLATESLQQERFDLSRAGRETLAEAITDAKYGFQFGALLRIPLSDRFGIQTEATLNSSSLEYRFDDPDSDIIEIFDERYTDVNVPLLASWKLAFLRFHVGPVGHFFVSSTSDLRDPDGRERVWDSFHLGYAMGGSIDIGKLTFDLRYDGNFSKYGEDFVIGGETLRIDQAPKRWIGTVAYRF